MRIALFHPVAGYRPQRLLKIDFLPRRASDLTRASGGEDKKLQPQPPNRLLGCAQRSHEGRNVSIWHRREVIVGLLRGAHQDADLSRWGGCVSPFLRASVI